MGDHRIAVLPGDGVAVRSHQAVRILDTVMEHTAHGFVHDDILCGGQVWKETGPEWEEGAWDRVKNDGRHFPRRHRLAWRALGERRPRRGGVILGMRSDSTSYANVRPIRLYEGVKHKVHGTFRQVWDHDMVDMVVPREHGRTLPQPSAPLRRQGGRA